MTTNFTFDRRVMLWQYAPVVFWIAVIFYLSSDMGSMSQTSRFIRPLVEFLFPAAPEQTLIIYHSYIRKAAHFTEYAVLAFLAVRALSISATVRLHKWRYILPLLLVTGIAAIDEFHQSFEISRTGSIQDVMLDISGGVVMITMLFLLKLPNIEHR
ncbi:MAG: VanZ family protein [Pyrinomonadaceae bacterium]|nr:VanZ family protein [Pyrinomonadaceae bacterium]